MKTWKTEKARLVLNGVEFPTPKKMTSTEKVEIPIDLDVSLFAFLD